MPKSCTFKIRSTLAHHDKCVNQVIITKEGYMISVGDDKLLAVLIWDTSTTSYRVVATGKCSKKAKAVEYDYKRQRIYVGCFLGAVDVFELTPTLTIVHKASYKWHSRECSYILFLPYHDIIISAGFDRQLVFFDCLSNRVLCNYTVASEFIRQIYYDDVGGKLYLATHEGQGIPVFNLEEPRLAAQIPPTLAFRLGNNKRYPGHYAPVRWIDFKPISRYIFSCDHSGKILIFQAGNPGDEVAMPALGQLLGHNGSKIRRVLWDDSSKVLYSCGKDACVSVWDILGPFTIGYFPVHGNEVMGMLFMDSHLKYVSSLYEAGTHSSNLLLTWGKDSLIKLWNIIVN